MRRTLLLIAGLALLASAAVGGAVLANTNGPDSLMLCSTPGGNVVLPEEGACRQGEPVEVPTVGYVEGLAARVAALEAVISEGVGGEIVVTADTVRTARIEGTEATPWGTNWLRLVSDRVVVDATGQAFLAVNGVVDAAKFYGDLEATDITTYALGATNLRVEDSSGEAFTRILAHLGVLTKGKIGYGCDDPLIGATCDGLLEPSP